MKLYANALLITNDSENRVIQPGCMAVTNGRISYVGKETEGNFPPEVERLDMGGRVLMPGQILGHTHLYSFLARGLAPEGAPQNFVEQLQQMWWRLDRALKLEDVYWSAKGACLEALLSGTTTVIDHHASPSCIEGSLEALAKGIAEIGIRGALAYEITDRNGFEGAQQGIEENLRGMEIAKEMPGFLAARIGLHASFTLSDKTLDAVAEKMPRIGIHIHVAEDWEDVDLSRELHGGGVLQRLGIRGLLDEQSILVHGVHLEEDELHRLAESGAFLVHNPRSNMNNGVGAANLMAFEAAGVNLAMGSDGMGPDPAPEAMAALLLQRHRAGSPSVAWPLIQKIYCEGNPRLATRTFGIPLGKLEAGAAADFIVRDYQPPTPLNQDNWWGHFLFGLASTPVDMVVVAGDTLVSHGQPVNLDAGQVWHECRRRAHDLWARW